ncbi:MAG: transaldolase [Candidatus Omnitrophica bacterium]|nr:transaldolase [Candidatus Omnitrophota bacterium]
MTLLTGNPLKEVLKYGQGVWYDGLVSVEEFRRLIEEDGIRGATTNPTIFEKAISGGQYDAEFQSLTGVQNEELVYQAIAVKAVQEVADVFRPVYEETNGRDGFVSMEVSPFLAHDTEGTVREARELFGRVGRKNLMIKVPATKEGIPAVETLIAEGVSVNVTLIFSVERYREVMEAYLKGSERRLAKGLPLHLTASVASFFVSRVDTAVDKRLVEKAGHQRLAGKAAIANSKAAYEEFEKTFFSARFMKLKEKGAQVQRPLWASTGTKDPRYRDVLYVEALIGPDTVNTIPPATLAAFRDHGTAAARLKENRVEARRVLEELKGVGVDLSEITRDLEKAGVEAFSESYRKILQVIRGKIED